LKDWKEMKKNEFYLNIIIIWGIKIHSRWLQIVGLLVVRMETKSYFVKQ